MRRMLRQFRPLSRRPGAWAALLLLLPLSAAAEITVYAAASLQDAVESLADSWEEPVVTVYAGSSAIARQVAAGAPADVVLLASADWADWLVAEGVVAADAVVIFAGNTLVLAGPAGAHPVSETPDIVALLAGGRLSMALTEAVPAGQYGRAALERLGQWEAVAPFVVEGANVRAALRQVARGEASLGIGYGTDIAADAGLASVWTFPADSHPPIRYAGAALTEAGAPFLDYLTGPEGQAVLAGWGFAPPPETP